MLCREKATVNQEHPLLGQGSRFSWVWEMILTFFINKISWRIVSWNSYNKENDNYVPISTYFLQITKSTNIFTNFKILIFFCFYVTLKTMAWKNKSRYWPLILQNKVPCFFLKKLPGRYTTFKNIIVPKIQLHSIEDEIGNTEKSFQGRLKNSSKVPTNTDTGKRSFLYYFEPLDLHKWRWN